MIIYVENLTDSICVYTYTYIYIRVYICIYTDNKQSEIEIYKTIASTII